MKIVLSNFEMWAECCNFRLLSIIRLNPKTMEKLCFGNSQLPKANSHFS